MNKLNVFTKISFVLLWMGVFSCKNTDDNPNPDSNNSDENQVTIDTTYDPTYPDRAATIGFFLNNWQAKEFVLPSNVKPYEGTSGDADVTVTVNMNDVVTKVSKYVYGNNSNTWMGQMVDQPKLLQYIKDLSPHIIRAPGGSISDIYFWNELSAPPSDAPAQLLDGDGNEVPGDYWFGKNTADWTLSIDHYYQVLQQTNSEGIITVNYAYARYGTGSHPVQTAAHLAAEWVRYDNGRTKYWEVGNENNGNWEAGYRIDVSNNQEGQPEIITGKLYGKHFKVFADSMRAAASEIGSTIYIGAQLLDEPGEAWQTATDKNWNEGVLTEAGETADYFVTHDYFTDYYTDASPKEILSTGVTVPEDIMDYFDDLFSEYSIKPKPIALTEWNIFSEGSQQMVSDIAGIHAAIVLGELIQNKFGEASRWDLANGWDDGNDQGMFNNGDEPDAPKWNPRPAFYYMYYFQKTFGDRMVASSVDGSSDILCYASSFGKGEAAGLVLINTGKTVEKVRINIQHFSAGNHFYWYSLQGGSGKFSRKVLVNGQGTQGVSGGPLDYATLPAHKTKYDQGIFLTVEPKSVIYINVPK
ncbi:MAG TPA: hypothetical protein VK084_00670 [Chitinophagaceae bacterium]|nr:hypothetical protein [Chitinophagaceae bacterium]